MHTALFHHCQNIQEVLDTYSCFQCSLPHKEGNAALYLEFAGKKFEVHISNPDKKEYGEYQIVQAYCDEKEIEKRAGGSACMKKETIEQLSSDETHNITIVLQ